MTRDLRSGNCISSACDVQTSCGRAVCEMSPPRILKHIERTKAIAVLIESASSNPERDFEKLMGEMRLHNGDLPAKVKVVVFTKADLVDTSRLNEFRKVHLPKNLRKHVISAVTGQGVKELIEIFWGLVKRKN